MILRKEEEHRKHYDIHANNLFIILSDSIVNVDSFLIYSVNALILFVTIKYSITSLI